MKLAVTAVESASSRAPFLLRGAFASSICHAAEIGYDAIELHLPDPAHVDPAAIRQACAAAGIFVSSIGTGLACVEDGLSLTSLDGAVRSRALVRMRDFIRLGGELGGVVIIGLIKGLAKDCGDRAAYMARLADALDHCLSAARQYGATLVLEAVNRYESEVLNTIEECAAFIDGFQSNQLKLHIDTFHMNVEEGCIALNIAAAGGRIGHVHVADSNRLYPGRGHYDFAETIAALRRAGYAGVLSVECLALPTPEEAARGACRFLRDALETVGRQRFPPAWKNGGTFPPLGGGGGRPEGVKY